MRVYRFRFSAFMGLLFSLFLNQIQNGLAAELAAADCNLYQRLVSRNDMERKAALDEFVRLPVHRKTLFSRPFEIALASSDLFVRGFAAQALKEVGTEEAKLLFNQYSNSEYLGEFGYIEQDEVTGDGSGKVFKLWRSAEVLKGFYTSCEGGCGDWLITGRYNAVNSELNFETDDRESFDLILVDGNLLKGTFKNHYGTSSQIEVKRNY